MQRCLARAAILCLAVLGAALLPGVLAAQTTIYPVVITSQQGMEKQMAVLHGSARAAIEASADYRLGGGDTVMYGIPASSLDFVSQAQSLFDTAKADYENLELDSAIEKLNLSMGKLEGGAAYLTDLSMATHILYYLGVCHSFNGDEAMSSEAFLRAYVLAPDKKPDPDVFPPDVIDMFNIAVSGVHGIGTGTLSVNSDPGATQVYLDGKFMGLTPVTIDNIVAGKHFVRLVHVGYQLNGQTVVIKTDKTQTINAKLFPAYNASKVFTLADGLPAQLVKGVDVAAPSLGSICTSLGVSQLLIIWVTSGDASYLSASFFVYDSLRAAVIAQRQGDSLPVQEGMLSMKGDELSRNTLLAALQADAAGTGVVTVIGGPTTGGGAGGGEGGVKSSVASKWWFWLALIGGAAVIGGATTAGVCLGTDACSGGGPSGPGGSGDLIFEF
ncbi:MAG: PEGA domain-containing protein [Deltaproteobacteria bacterium]|nr:PEGA domain-containing protein [Deltaproteobacteria bacterium]